MTIPPRPTFDSIDSRWAIRITDDGSATLVDRVNGDSMHSGCGAIAETEHVYLRNSGVSARLKQRQPTRILEVGLGSGLGCLLTAAAANQHLASVQYVALENRLPPAEVVEQLGFERQGIDRRWIAAYCEMIRRTAGRDTLCGPVGEHCRLTVYQRDAETWSGKDEPAFDAIYFDPFSPETNPALWSPRVLAEMHRCLTPQGRLVSYCVNRRVRDTLNMVGFDVQRVPGPVGGKREVLIATAR